MDVSQLLRIELVNGQQTIQQDVESGELMARKLVARHPQEPLTFVERAMIACRHKMGTR